jgi:hypothetical protein
MANIDIQSNLSTAKFRQSVLQELVSGLTISGSTTPIPVTLRTDSSGYKLFHKAQSAASTNATVVKSAPASIGLLSMFHASGSGGSKFVKIYNKATTPTASDVPIFTFVIRPNETINIVPAIPFFFDQGLSYRMTANYADSDNTGVAAGELAINVAYA